MLSPPVELSDAVIEERAVRRYPDVRSARLAVLLYKRDCDFHGFVEPEDDDAQQGVTIEGIERSFDDDFTQDTSLRAYDVIDESHNVTGRSSWYVKGGLLHQAGDLKQIPEAAGQRSARRGSMLIRKYEIYKHFELSVHFTRRDGHLTKPGGVVFCMEDSSNYYLLLAEPPLPLRLYKIADDRFYIVHQADAITDTYDCGVTVQVTRVNDTMKVVYGPHVFLAHEGTHRTGRVGLLACRNSILCVSHFACKLYTDLPRPIYFEAPFINRQYTFDDTCPALGTYAEIVDYPGTRFGPSQWVCERGRLQQRSNIRHTSDLPVAQARVLRGSLLVFTAPVMYAEVRYRMCFGGAMGLDLVGLGFVFQYQDINNYYLVRYEEVAAALRLVLVCHGHATELAVVPVAASLAKGGSAVPVEVFVHRTYKNSSEFTQHIAVKVAHLPTVEVSNLELPHPGRCGFLAFNNAHFTVSYLTVEVSRDTVIGPPERPPPPRVVQLCKLLAAQSHELKELHTVDEELRSLPKTITKKKYMVNRGRAATADAPPARPLTAAWQNAYDLVRRDVKSQQAPVPAELD